MDKSKPRLPIRDVGIAGIKTCCESFGIRSSNDMAWLMDTPVSCWISFCVSDCVKWHYLIHARMIVRR